MSKLYYKSQGGRGQTSSKGGNLTFLYLHQCLSHLSNDVQDAIFLSRVSLSVEDLVAERHHWIERVPSLLTDSGEKRLGGYVTTGDTRSSKMSGRKGERAGPSRL